MDKSPGRVQARFRQVYGRNERVPDRRSLRQWFTKFEESGSVQRKERRNTRFVRTEENVQDTLEIFAAEPHMSQRRAANELGFSHQTVHRILKEYKWHPYKLQMIQALEPNDLVSRVTFAQNQLDLLAAEPNFFQRIDWSDEAHFHLDGGVNKQDFRYWSTENPHWHRSQALYPPRVTVWAAIGSSGIIGPYFFEGNVNGDNYLHMLRNFYLPQVQNRPGFANQVFQQDGAPPHWRLTVRDWLNANFPNRWIGRGSPIMPWPPRSPDLTPMDYFLWGILKSKVYRTPLANLAELRARIIEAFAEVTPEMIQNVIASYERRLRKCIEVGGESVEK
uniref:DUF4817 domain-containing protein n=1 Tax=Panagrolaimus davidi TaxID=227884 RepID=A0A914PQU3_9BILA